MIGSELFGIQFNQFVLANNILVFDSVKHMVFVQTLILSNFLEDRGDNKGKHV